MEVADCERSPQLKYPKNQLLPRLYLDAWFSTLAQSLNPMQLLPSLYAELSTNNIDVCFISETFDFDY